MNARDELTEMLSRVEVTGFCWLWRGSIGTDGYGITYFMYTKKRAHRRLYSLLVEPVPDELDIDHLCRIKNCVNPDHLEPVTRGENNRRAYKVQPVRGGLGDTHCRAGHEYTEANTRYRGKGRGRACRQCASAYARAHYVRKRAEVVS